RDVALRLRRTGRCPAVRRRGWPARGDSRGSRVEAADSGRGVRRRRPHRAPSIQEPAARRGPGRHGVYALMTMYANRVVVTGLGAVTPAGNDVPAFWRSLVEGRSGVRPIEALAAAGVRPSYAAEVTGLAPDAGGLPRRRQKMMGRQAQ